MTKEEFIADFINRALNIDKFKTDRVVFCETTPCIECRYAYRSEHNHTCCFAVAYRDRYMPHNNSAVDIFTEITHIVQKCLGVKYKKLDL